MKYEAIFSDIDGTLLNSKHVVTTKTKEALLQFTKAGGTFVLASARGPMGIAPVIHKNGFDCAVIAYNGALILDTDGTVLYENGMTQEEAGRMLAFLEEHAKNVTWNLYTKEQWIVKSRRDCRVMREEAIVETEAEEGTLMDLPQDMPVDKILCMCEPEEIIQIEQLFKQAFPEEVEIVRSSDTLLEITKAGSKKAAALKRFCGQKGIPLDRTIAFGDNYNDVEMLMCAGAGVLMGNAPQELKENFAGNCRFVTADHNSDGIAAALPKILN